MLRPDAENDSMMDPSELLIEESTCTNEEYLQWQEKIPYYLKRFQNLSIKTGIHILSLIIAYEKAKVKKGSSQPKPSEILSMNFYKMNKDGSIGEVVMDNKHNAAAALLWIREGVAPNWENAESYYDEMLDFSSICRRAKIDLASEDPHRYTKEFMSNLVVTYIASNKEACKRLNPNVVEGLKSLSMNKFGKAVAPEKKKTLDFQSMAVTKKLAFFSTIEEDIEYAREKINKHSEMVTLVMQVKALSGIDFDGVTDKTRTDHGFYIDKRGNYMILPVKVLFNNKKNTYIHLFAMIHCSGYLILIDDSDTLTYLTLSRAKEYIRDYAVERERIYLTNKRYGNNCGYGKWEETVR